ncbi:tetratricopeptide repeat protein [bacterium]|nr:tetratricopeptide repeat protein [bacterium]
MKKLAFLFLAFSIFIGCNEQKSNATEPAKQTSEEKLSSALSLVKSNKTNEAIILFTELLNEKGELAAQAAFNLGTIYREQEKPNQAIKYYEILITSYPNSPKYKECVFMAAYVYANSLKDFKNAEKYYREFLVKFPKDELAASVTFELENLGKDVTNIDELKKNEEKHK